MAHTIVRYYLHIVFSTKHRQPLIHPHIESALHEYLDTVCRRLGCFPLMVGGFFDHVHILCMMSDKVSLEDLVGNLKRESSGWIRTKGEVFGAFNWQDGYGAFSVSAAEIDLLKHYIQHQHRHHSNLLFEDEYKRMLNEYELEYDEKYLWD